MRKNVKSLSLIRRGPDYKKRNVWVAEFEIKKRATYNDVLDFLKANNIPESLYGVRISATSTEIWGGLVVPKHIVKFFREIGGSIVFSFDCDLKRSGIGRLPVGN